VGQPNLGVSRVELAREPLNLHRVRVIDVLPPEEIPVLANEHVDDRSLDLHVRVAEAERRAAEELTLGRPRRGARRREIALEIRLHQTAHPDTVGLRGPHLKAEARVADAHLRAPVVAAVGVLLGGCQGGDAVRPQHLRTACGVVEALGRVVDEIELGEAVDGRRPSPHDEARRVGSPRPRRSADVAHGRVVLRLRDDPLLEHQSERGELHDAPRRSRRLRLERASSGGRRGRRWRYRRRQCRTWRRGRGWSRRRLRRCRRPCLSEGRPGQKRGGDERGPEERE